MTREERKMETQFNEMLKRHGHALVHDNPPPPPQPKYANEVLYAAQRFGLDPANVVWYNCGTCYDRIGVRTKADADKVSAKVKGSTANGGMLDGMPLGGQSRHNDGTYEIYC